MGHSGPGLPTLPAPCPLSFHPAELYVSQRAHLLPALFSVTRNLFPEDVTIIILLLCIVYSISCEPPEGQTVSYLVAVIPQTLAL